MVHDTCIVVSKTYETHYHIGVFCASVCDTASVFKIVYDQMLSISEQAKNSKTLRVEDNKSHQSQTTLAPIKCLCIFCNRKSNTYSTKKNNTFWRDREGRVVNERSQSKRNTYATELPCDRRTAKTS